MTEAQEPKDIRRGTIFGRDAINRNDLLKALVVDGQDKVRLDDIQNYVNKSQQQAQHLGWYKFAALFGFIIIIVQALTTFGVVLWGADVSREKYEISGDMIPAEQSAENIYAMLDEGGIMPVNINGLVVEDNDGNLMSFNDLACVGYSSTEGVEDTYQIYTTSGAVVTVTKDELSVTIGENTYTKPSSGSRRRLDSLTKGEKAKAAQKCAPWRNAYEFGGFTGTMNCADKYSTGAFDATRMCWAVCKNAWLCSNVSGYDGSPVCKHNKDLLGRMASR